ncbi:MAG TPA: hypothetical protein VLH80_07320 [Nitrospiraceae bacterium]|nr:hypothetical protein [Nitrospiraceae bacterium]
MNPKIPPLVSGRPPQPPATPNTAALSRPIPPPAGKPALVATAPTAEGVMQRLRYFENLAGQYEHYIKTLQAALARTGQAVPVGYFAPLTGEAGSYTPKVSAS